MSPTQDRNRTAAPGASLADNRHERDIRILSTNLEDMHARITHMLTCNHIHTEALARSYARAYVHSADTTPDSEGLPPIDPRHIAAFHEQLATATAAIGDSSMYACLTEEISKQMTSAEQICFYRTLVSDSTVDTHALAAYLLGQPEPTEPSARGRVIYQHNIYTDEAFLHFSRVLPTAKACYSDSFTGVCEQVFDGQCEYCILPLENTQDGKLVRFYGLIEKYELKIVLTCKVTTSDNRHSTVFGLCRRGIVWPLPLLRDKNVCFEFIFWQDPGQMSLSRLLCAAECASLSLLRADCLPRSDDEILMGVGYPFDLCFELASHPRTSSSAPEHDFLAFLLFLSIHAPTHLSLGIYQNI